MNETNETMTRFNARFKANNIEDLKTFKCFGIKNASIEKISGLSLFATWICENPNTTHEDIMDEISMIEAEAFGIELLSFFKS